MPHTWLGNGILVMQRRSIFQLAVVLIIFMVLIFFFWIQFFLINFSLQPLNEKDIWMEEQDIFQNSFQHHLGMISMTKKLQHTTYNTQHHSSLKRQLNLSQSMKKSKKTNHSLCIWHIQRHIHHSNLKMKMHQNVNTWLSEWDDCFVALL